MTKTAWVFPGQGSQTVGMEENLLDHPLARMRFAQAEEILNWSVLELCQGDEERLSQTQYTQPCLYVVETVLAELLLKQDNPPVLVAGHSLGEYVALYTAGVFDFETGLKLVKSRAELMSTAAGGKMVAMMQFNREELETQIAAIPDVVIANDNSPQQVVISGTPTGVDALIAQVKARRKVDLKVSGAFHSPLMQSAAAEFAEILADVTFNDARIPVLANIDPTPAIKAAEIKSRLVQQMTGAVRWREIGDYLAQSGITKVVEIGPGKVLTGLLKRTSANLEVKNVSRIDEFSY
ncbi:ACP S-malonyltransferase [Gloeocapsa sp. PCC 73106]|uniref:ACP S-malonyltransferase n=1 Tax=Gloeocapsa sp. PCC 73106 TaxID=102232 RepID=UPI0002ACCD13|nr:ACP S-malonyltransferase [Gloeocapsa sp. PCC 73106]ELR96964.1 malonyl CoA-acyl carrier protein transacylase [Gloeocapsa sp. PCC 73106]